MKKLLRRALLGGLFLLLAVCVFLVWTLWPLRQFLTQEYLHATYLVLFTNEAEARPCGGFVTAFGYGTPLPPNVELKNSYHFESESFGVAGFPLTKVSPELKFWDMGTSPNMDSCAYEFSRASKTLFDVPPEKIVFVDIGTLIAVLTSTGAIQTPEGTITADTFFADLTRQVANVDRHDEQSLQVRKKPLATLGKYAAAHIIVRPHLWPGITRILANHIEKGSIYVSGISPPIIPAGEDFSVVEWNLGGAKSSRYLDKALRIHLREVSPGVWSLDGLFTARHLGGRDEPLSQPWQGVFEFRLPTMLGGRRFYEEATIAPGEIFSVPLRFTVREDLEQISFFRPRSQSLRLELSVSAFPQQRIISDSLTAREGVGTFFGELDSPRTVFTWRTKEDTLPPFLTLHTVVGEENIPPNFLQEIPQANFFVEVHFNEAVKLLPHRKAFLFDRDYFVPQTLEHPQLVGMTLLDDRVTLLLGFTQKNKQYEERYTLRIEGIADIWGNEMPLLDRTVIDRVPGE